jgi:pseudouridine-5'-phosphate glycosidase
MTSKDFRLPNGNVIDTVLEIVNKKHIPVEGFGTMPSPFFYIRAESGTVNIPVTIPG